MRRPDPGLDLAASLADVARSLLTAETVDDVLRRVVTGAVGVVEGTEAASVSLIDRDRRWTGAASGPLAVAADELQFAAGTGPCFSALDQPVVHFDPAANDEWRGLARSWRAADVASALSCGLHQPRRRSPRATLNVYSSRADAFTARSAGSALAFATHAAIGLAAAEDRHASGLAEGQAADALAHRDIIGQAKGILMERSRSSADEAFDVLRRASQRLNRRVRDIAADIVTGHCPDSDAPTRPGT